MQPSPLNWQALTVQYPFNDRPQAVGFFDFQTNAKQAISQFCASENSHVLILKSETLPAFFHAIQDYFAELSIPAHCYTEFDRQRLFGYALYLTQENRTEVVQGILPTLNNAVLVLNLRELLADLSQWDKLKQALFFGQYQLEMINPVPQPLPSVNCAFKLVLVGSRDDIATLYGYDDNLYQFSQYAEIDAYLSVDEESLEQWGNYVQSSAQKWLGKGFSPYALNQFLQQAVRESESQQLLSISPTWLKKQLLGLSAFYPNAAQFTDIQAYFDAQESRAAVLNRYVLQDILSEQQYIETEGECVGQINGLSVVEFDGVPYSFGEPIRISCNVQYGDGEIHDIERKVELGGNIHSKGILIAQSCLGNLLELPTQLPFSATLAFEQSYGEIDGDSSALAIFCVLMSALTKLPLPQSLAVTGSIDQFGNVLSVGGVNSKIEGFFNLCQARGLDSKQGVIIPAVCLSHLSLKPAVVEAVKAGQFHIWAVNDVFEALELLLDTPFFDDDLPPNSEKSSLFSLANDNIERRPDASGSFWQKMCKLIGKA